MKDIFGGRGPPFQPCFLQAPPSVNGAVDVLLLLLLLLLLLNLARVSCRARGEWQEYAETRDRTGDLQIFSLTLSQLSYRGS